MKKLLLHCCCAPCASHVIETLRSQYAITVLFYNPNIIPQEEQNKRRLELLRLIKILNENCIGKKIQLYETANIHEAKLKPHDCEACIHHRLKFTSEVANSACFDFFTTTLTISPHKNAELINKIGASLSSKYLPANFKKQDGFKKSIELSKKFNLYRQNYCGCEPRAAGQSFKTI